MPQDSSSASTAFSFAVTSSSRCRAAYSASARAQSALLDIPCRRARSLAARKTSSGNQTAIFTSLLYRGHAGSPSRRSPRSVHAGLVEVLPRAADQRASSLTIADKLLQGPGNDDAGHWMDGSHRPLAQPVAGGTPTPPPGGDFPPRRELDGDGRRAGERGVDSGTTRPPHSAIRCVETSVGIVSCQEPRSAARRARGRC